MLVGALDSVVLSVSSVLSVLGELIALSELIVLSTMIVCIRCVDERVLCPTFGTYYPTSIESGDWRQ